MHRRNWLKAALAGVLCIFGVKKVQGFPTRRHASFPKATAVMEAVLHPYREYILEKATGCTITTGEKASGTIWTRVYLKKNTPREMVHSLRGACSRPYRGKVSAAYSSRVFLFQPVRVDISTFTHEMYWLVHLVETN